MHVQLICKHNYLLYLCTLLSILHESMKTAIIGGGAAGFFLAINLKELNPNMDVTIFEKGSRVLRKVAVSGGGRCNCTNSFDGVKDLRHVYPRGFRLIKRLFNIFDYKDAYNWFERHGIELTTQSDNCVFPKSQSSQSVINCFLREANKHQIHIKTKSDVDFIYLKNNFDFIAVTTGGSQSLNSYKWLADIGHDIINPIPSLYSLAVNDTSLTNLMGRVVEHVKMQIAGTKIKSEGSLLITHWGISGPAVLYLSSFAAQLLAEQNYKAQISINWSNMKEQEIEINLLDCIKSNPQKQITNYNPFALSQNLWKYIVEKSLQGKSDKKWIELNKKEIHRLSNTISNDVISIVGRAPHRDEFVTCGGIKLDNINFNTMESKVVDNLFFAGEVLDIDGITGGFNSLSAWTTAYVAAKSIAEKSL